MSIKSWPEDCRPREKLLRNGAASLSDAELLALFIGTGRAGQSALDIAREWLQSTGGLRQLVSLPWEQASKLKGLGLARFAELQAARALMQRALAQQLQRGELVSGFADAAMLAKSHLQDLTHEAMIMLSFDTQLRLLACDELARGNAQFINIHPRTVVSHALTRNASGVIIAHNHPSGCKEPSQADIRFTREVNAALKLMQIKLHDHILVADGPAVSFQALGLL